MIPPSEPTQMEALAEIAAEARKRLADPGYRATVDQRVAAFAEDFAGLGGGELTSDVALGYLAGSMMMLVALLTHTIGQDLPCFATHVNHVWDPGVALLDARGGP